MMARKEDKLLVLGTTAGFSRNHCRCCWAAAAKMGAGPAWQALADAGKPWRDWIRVIGVRRALADAAAGGRKDRLQVLLLLLPCTYAPMCICRAAGRW